MGSGLESKYVKVSEIQVLGLTNKIAYECPNESAAFTVNRDVATEYKKNKFEDFSVTLSMSYV